MTTGLIGFAGTCFTGFSVRGRAFVRSSPSLCVSAAVLAGPEPEKMHSFYKILLASFTDGIIVVPLRLE